MTFFHYCILFSTSFGLVFVLISYFYIGRKSVMSITGIASPEERFFFFFLIVTVKWAVNSELEAKQTITSFD